MELNVIKTTVNGHTDLENGTPIFQLIEYLEEYAPDSTFLYDVNLQPLLDYLLEGGYTENEIEQMNKNRYGRIVEIIYYKDIELYVLEYGVI